MSIRVGNTPAVAPRTFHYTPTVKDAGFTGPSGIAVPHFYVIVNMNEADKLQGKVAIDEAKRVVTITVDASSERATLPATEDRRLFLGGAPRQTGAYQLLVKSAQGKLLLQKQINVHPPPRIPFPVTGPDEAPVRNSKPVDWCGTPPRKPVVNWAAFSPTRPPELIHDQGGCFGTDKVAVHGNLNRAQSATVKIELTGTHDSTAEAAITTFPQEIAELVVLDKAQKKALAGALEEQLKNPSLPRSEARLYAVAIGNLIKG